MAGYLVTLLSETGREYQAIVEADDQSGAFREARAALHVTEGLKARQLSASPLADVAWIGPVESPTRWRAVKPGGPDPGTY